MHAQGLNSQTLLFGYFQCFPIFVYVFIFALRSCSKIRHIKCSEMYLIVILNPMKTEASAEERVFALSADYVFKSIYF
jgi:hypothetical protein